LPGGLTCENSRRTLPANGTLGTRLGPQEARIMGRRRLCQHATRAVVPLRSDVQHCLVVDRNSTWPTLMDRRRLDAEGDGVADVTHLGDVSAVVRLQRVVSWRT
jgi:hypothetical protein